MNLVKKEIINKLERLPYGLFEVIKESAIKSNSNRIAFVGGIIRDILLNYYHKNEINKIHDIDLIIEGDPLALADKIKMLLEPKVFLKIKAKSKYNTIEIQGEDIRIDIALARSEEYKSPGYNPITKNSYIEKDLLRRDFTVNSIAFDPIEEEIIDINNGINDIKEKRLELLHNSSIKDDPTRIIRAARYSSRLNLELSTSSLNQIQRTLDNWPWIIKRQNNKNKFPEAIGTRLRMELELLLNEKNYQLAFKKMNEWGVISLFNSDLVIDNKFFRSFLWGERLGLNKLLIFISSINSYSEIIDRLSLSEKNNKIIEEYHKITKELDNISEKSFSPGELTDYIELNRYNKEAILLYISKGNKSWSLLLRWLNRYRKIKSPITGDNLIEKGWVDGHKIGEEIRRLRNKKINQFRNKKIS
tara:strand:+ start:1167 stop:2417 length:1251 start_codon:yes stop_codon:yes gene_type:complete